MNEPYPCRIKRSLDVSALCFADNYGRRQDIEDPHTNNYIVFVHSCVRYVGVFVIRPWLKRRVLRTLATFATGGLDISAAHDCFTQASCHVVVEVVFAEPHESEFIGVAARI